MKIGEDYEKIEFEAFGLDLLEPNAFIGDMLIAGLAFYALWIFRNTPKDAFFTNWRRFFFVFGMSFVAGALGHLMFNYWGIPGKYASWYLGIFSPYFIEQAMMSVHPEQKTGKLLLKLSNAKLLLALIAETLMLALTDVEATPTNGLHVVTATTSIGLIFSLGYLGVKYEKAIGRPFRYLWYSVLTMIPILAFQLGKINFFQWFDRNDVSHVLLFIGVFYYVLGVRAYKDSRPIPTLSPAP